MTQVVPAQVDRAEGVLRVVGQALVVQARGPGGRVAVGAEHERLPGAMEQPQGVAHLVAEDERLVGLLLPFRVDTQPGEHVAQPVGGDRYCGLGTEGMPG